MWLQKLATDPTSRVLQLRKKGITWGRVKGKPLDEALSEHLGLSQILERGWVSAQGQAACWRSEEGGTVRMTSITK